MDAISIILRFVLGGLAVAGAAQIGRRLGGRIGGMFAAFPAVFGAAILSVGVSQPGVQGLVKAIHVSQGALVGMLGDVITAIVAASAIPKIGWRKGIALSLGVWLFSSTLIYIVAREMRWVG